ncbi:MAG TPA: TerC family protein [Opitutaceae bacterium]|nr:TerC family protein [Opitutaceae bacterium]
MPLTCVVLAVTATPWWAWTVFFVCIALLLALDLGLIRRESHPVPMGEALKWCAVWISLALGFNALVWWWRGDEAAEQFLAGYLVELGMSVDNLFVFLLVFAWFKVKPAWQHRVLFWGILGAVIMRGAFILAGVSLLQRFHWIIYLFGAFLVFTGVRLALPKKSTAEIEPEKNPVVRLFRRFFPVAAEFDGPKFFTRENGLRLATPLFLALLVVETTDLVFALDSLPAVLAITTDVFVALTSNIFAVLGLRSLYFALSGLMPHFRFLKAGLAVIMVFVGIKMLAAPWISVSTALSLGVIGTVLLLAVLASMISQKTPAQG